MPTWYFNLPDQRGTTPYFLDWDALSDEERAVIDFDPGYCTQPARKYDAAWQAWHSGFILDEAEKAVQRIQVVDNVYDNYRFVRKYFHPLWSWYVLGIRLVTFQAPWREIPAFWKSRRIKRHNLYERVYPHEEDYRRFASGLVKKQPKVSVIIPTLNRYRYLKDGLHDLEQQTYHNFDLIVVDQSEPFNEGFYKDFDLNMQVIRQEEKALWQARNTAIQYSDADYLVLFDDDSRVNSDWIMQHLKCLDYFKADISSGVSISMVGAAVPQNYSFFRWSDQVDTGNVLVHRRVFEKLGLFDRQFEQQRQGDGEFGLRAYLAGFKNISNPYAKRLHLKVDSGGLRQMGHWDGFRPKSWLAPRPVPSVLYLVRRYFGNQAAIHLLIMQTAPSLIPYRFKRNRWLLMLGVPFCILLLPLVLYQVGLSWWRSTKMLQEGPLIATIQVPVNRDVSRLSYFVQ